MDKEIQNEVFLRGFGPQERAEEGLCGARYYASARDPIPLFDFRALYRQKAPMAILSPHPNAPWFDHWFQSPTLQSSIQDSLDIYTDYFEVHY